MSKKILVVDDEKDFLETIRARLEKNGYSVITAVDGEEGIEKAKKEKPDLILMDIMMPKMDGYTALRMLKHDEITTGIPVIMLTCKEKMKDLFSAEGAKGYIVKPYKEEDLLETIKKALE